MSDIPIEEEIARRLGVPEDAIATARRDPRGIPASLLEQGAIDTPRFEQLVELVRETVALTLKRSDVAALTCRGCGSRWKVRGAHPSRRYRCRRCRGLLVIDLSVQSLSGGEEIREEGEARELPPDVLRAMEKPANLFGKYVLLAEVGRGGMGRVFRAYDTDLGRTVALKMMLLQSDDDLARFRQEAKLAAQLDHPGIVQVHEMGEQDGRPYIAMQFVEGASLEGTRLPLPKAVAALRDAARAIAYAHERGVIHRDLKPGNLLQSADGRIRVGDFGLAKRSDVRSVSGSVVGTPAYMSPEQARGETHRVDPRSDVYSLGATLYGLLGGAPPFTGSDIPALLAAVAHDDPVPIRRIASKVPPDLETIVLKAMEKEPDRRYASAADLADDLDRFLQGEPVVARRASVVYRLRKAAAKRTSLVAAVLGVALAAGLAAVLIPRLGEERAARERVQKEKETGEALAGRLRELQTLWTRVVLAKQGLHQRAADPDKVRDRIRETLAEVDRFVEANPSLSQGHYVRARGRLYLDDPDGAERDLRKAVEGAPDFLPAYLLLGQVALQRQQWMIYGIEETSQGRNEAQRPHVEEASRFLVKGLTGGPERASSIERWGLVKTREDEITRVVALALHARYVEKDTARAQRLLQEANDREGAAEFCNWLGLWATDAAAVHRWQSLAIEHMPHWAKPYLDRSEAAIRRKDLDGAIADLDQAIRLDPRLALAHGNRGVAHHLKQRYDRALADHGRAIELCPEDPLLLVNRALTHIARNDRAAARADLERALGLDPRCVPALLNRGIVHGLNGDLSTARADLDQAVLLDPKSDRAFKARSQVRIRQGDLDGAIADATRALDIRSGDAELLLQRAELRFMKGDRQGAVTDADAAVRAAPDQSKPVGMRGFFRFETGDPDGARRDLDRSIELDPRNAVALVARGGIRLAAGDAAGAHADLDRGIELGYAPAPVFLLRAQALEKLAQADPSRALVLLPLARADATRALQSGLDPRKRLEAESLLDRISRE